ncbi:MAG: DUF3592 domain-containing protein [Acidimicrobiales bacterium]
MTSTLIFVVVGAFFIFGGYHQRAAIQPVAGGRPTTGTVVPVLNGENCGRCGCSPDRTPTIRFATTSGTPYTFVGPTYGSQISSGQTVTVSYDPASPDVAHDVSRLGRPGSADHRLGRLRRRPRLGWFVLGRAALHRRTGLTSARRGTGWVGHIHIHSNRAVVVGLAVIVARLVVGLLVV